MRITKKYGIISSKLEYDLLARLDGYLARGYTISAKKRGSFKLKGE